MIKTNSENKLRPELQIALDQTDFKQSVGILNEIYADIDIIEVGTILCLSEGMSSVRSLRKLYPKHIIVADYKAADAGEVLANLAFNSGADWFTVICAAPMATIATAQQIALSRNKEIQIELFGNWTIDEAKQWRSYGITQAIYHRGRDAELSGQSWSEQDLLIMKQLSDLGFQLSITGGITPDTLYLFKDINVKTFIVGRAISSNKNPKETAQLFQHKITEIWGD